jgi:ERCC4-type nuclease
MNLCVDYREKAILSRLKADTKTLILGDVCIEKDGQDVVIIERKTVADLAASICDGRYQEQSFRLLESTLPPHRIVYVIEGSLDSPQSITKKALLSSIMSLWFTKGFSVVQTASIDETVEFIEQLYEKTCKEPADPKEYVTTLKIKKKDKLTPETVDILMLSQIPNISTVTAKAILHTYTTIFALTQALKENPECLATFTHGEKNRKLAKNVISNLKLFLHI